MVALMVFDFTGKYIMMLYFMLVCSSYATYALYYWVLASNKMAACYDGKLQRKLQNAFCVIVHILYAVAIGLAFIKNFGTSCTSDHVYRKNSRTKPCIAFIFIMLFGKNVVFTLVILFFKARG